jgi:hypothetical protein
VWGPARRLDLLAGKAVVFQAARAAALSASRATGPCSSDMCTPVRRRCTVHAGTIMCVDHVF